jgi:hypothetical protein
VSHGERRKALRFSALRQFYQMLGAVALNTGDLQAAVPRFGSLHHCVVAANAGDLQAL